MLYCSFVMMKTLYNPRGQISKYKKLYMHPCLCLYSQKLKKYFCIHLTSLKNNLELNEIKEEILFGKNYPKTFLPNLITSSDELINYYFLVKRSYISKNINVFDEEDFAKSFKFYINIKNLNVLKDIIKRKICFMDLVYDKTQSFLNDNKLKEYLKNNL